MFFNLEEQAICLIICSLIKVINASINSESREDVTMSTQILGPISSKMIDSTRKDINNQSACHFNNYTIDNNHELFKSTSNLETREKSISNQFLCGLKKTKLYKANTIRFDINFHSEYINISFIYALFAKINSNIEEPKLYFSILLNLIFGSKIYETKINSRSMSDPQTFIDFFEILFYDIGITEYNFNHINSGSELFQEYHSKFLNFRYQIRKKYKTNEINKYNFSHLFKKYKMAKENDRIYGKESINDYFAKIISNHLETERYQPFLKLVPELSLLPKILKCKDANFTINSYGRIMTYFKYILCKLEILHFKIFMNSSFEEISLEDLLKEHSFIENILVVRILLEEVFLIFSPTQILKRSFAFTNTFLYIKSILPDFSTNPNILELIFEKDQNYII